MIRAIFPLLLGAAALTAADADLIFSNGKIVTVDKAFSIRQAIAIKGGRITAVGDDRAVLGAERGPHTRVIDLRGKEVLPGLIDSHVHPLEAGLSEFRAPLPPLDSYAAIQNYIRREAARTPKGEWIVVPRTFPTRLKEMAMPTKEVLDVDREHPVLFDASYVVVVNSLALKMSGITRDTPNPPRGEIVKGPDGEPNGILRNAQSVLKGRRKEASFSDSEKLEALEQMLERYRAAGLTSIGDGAVQREEISLYKNLKAQGKLPVRVAMTWWHDIAQPAEQIEREVRSAMYTTDTGDEWLKFAAFKVNVDGGMTIGTAYQRHPYGPFGRQLYAQTDPDSRGQLFAAPDKLLEVMRAARDRGWQLTTHCQGGGAIDVFLDVLEKLNHERPIAPTRSHLIHASFQSADAIRRMKQMGILADVQAAWLYLDGPALERVFGYEGMRYFFPLKSYLDNGIVVAGGSDHMIGFAKNTAVNPYNPFLGMWIEVARRTRAGRLIHAEEQITRRQALESYTIGGAYRQFAEKEKGSIEPGKLADLVVIDRDYLTCPEEQIKDIEPVMTVIGGKIFTIKQGSER